MEFYLEMMEAGHYAAPTPLYVASGLLTYLNASGATPSPRWPLALRSAGKQAYPRYCRELRGRQATPTQPLGLWRRVSCLPVIA